MSNCCCKNRFSCTAAAVIVSIVVGVVTAFLRITGEITLTSAFLWVTLGVALVFLAVTLLTASVAERQGCCSSLNALLIGALGTVLTSLVLLAITFAATSFFGAFLNGLLLFFFFLTLTSAACYVKCLCAAD